MGHGSRTPARALTVLTLCFTAYGGAFHSAGAVIPTNAFLVSIRVDMHSQSHSVVMDIGQSCILMTSTRITLGPVTV